MENEIRKRLVEIINNEIENGKFYELYGFYVANFNKVCANDDITEKLADELISASKDVKNDFMDTFDVYSYDSGVRVCDTCGKFMTEGYYLAGEYACSEKCAAELYNHDFSEDERVKMFQADLQSDEENEMGECFYTEW